MEDIFVVVTCCFPALFRLNLADSKRDFVPGLEGKSTCSQKHTYPSGEPGFLIGICGDSFREYSHLA